MSTELSKQFEPETIEPRWLEFWNAGGYFHADPDPSRPSHTIMIPLPNVTGALHLGHALNGTLQDLITRWKRMQGYVALWMPGTDHAGIATQAMVEKRLLEEEGKTRRDLGREALVERIWKWKDQYETRILSQLRRIGASCDWRRTRFTLDPVCSKAVRETFFKMFRDGLIYRGKRLVNWDTYLQTAVADDEVFHEDVAGKFWTFHYPVVDANGEPTDRKISFSTTRPETMLGDTAVCVHPTDERYAQLVGREVLIPLNGRRIPIIADALLADKEKGTGCVKVTPAHDPNDYQCGLRHTLPMINILNPDGTLNAQGGRWQGLDRYAAREAIVAEMDRLGHLEQVEDRVIPLMHSDRSKTAIEPYLSDQWFVRMGDLAQAAMDAVNDGRVRFFPQRYASTYLDWLGEKRDWCISRQLWWGHRIPVWAKPFADRTTADGALAELRRTDPAVAAGVVLGRVSGDEAAGEAVRIELCWTSDDPAMSQRFEAQGFVQDEDVLDTWFSSALWPHATLGWPDLSQDPPLASGLPGEHVQTRPTATPTPSATPAATATTTGNTVLPYFYPGSVLITSRDIITLWVARMVLTGLYNLGDVPFRQVHVHPKIQDGFGQTMSKTKGNGVDPLELIERYGCDGMRFTIASFAGETQDVRLPVGYLCPHCQAVFPQQPEHLKFRPGKPQIRCSSCKKESQYVAPWYTPDEGAPVATIVIERFEFGRNFCNKLWNAARFAILNLEGYTPGPVDPDQLPLEDRWILSRLGSITAEVNETLSRYQFDAATRALREFVWNEFCDWYIELLKPRLRDPETKPAAQRVLVTVLDTTLRLLHPFTPFITEELFQRLATIAPSRGLPEPIAAPAACIIAPWPAGFDGYRDPALEASFQRLQDLIVAVRNVRGTYNLTTATPLTVQLRCEAAVAESLQSVFRHLQNLAKAECTAAGPEVTRPKTAAAISLPGIELYVPLEGLIDRAAELAKQQKAAEKLRGFITSGEKRLGNASFVDKAPPEVVAEVRETLATQRSQLTAIEEIIRQLQDG